MFKKNVFKKLTLYKNPISIEKFVEICLYDQDGYYSTSNVLGSSGDFVTAPEISQLFGEILGLYIFDYWQQNIKQKFNLIELGPGRGTLLLDILRITKDFKDFNDSKKVSLVEKNINLINKQKNNFLNFNLNIKKIRWYKNFNNKFKDPAIIIANEFFDCFPVRQFYSKNNVWYEKMVQYDPINKFFKLIDLEINKKQTIKEITSYETVNLLEVSKSREKYFSKICQHLLKVGGVMIAFDYGYIDKPKNFSLQSVYNNKYSNVLDNIGSQDITSLVDFKSLIKIAKLNKLKIEIFSSQRDFLIQNGIYERSKKILSKCNSYQENIIKSGLNRIINKKNMGSIFKVLVVSKI